MSQLEQYGKYILLEKLSRGGMAEIFLTKSSGAYGVEKFFALKRILPRFSQSSSFIKMFKSEAEVAIHLSHNNIASIYEFGMEKNQFFIVMDFVSGRNLKEVSRKISMNNKMWSVPEAIFIIKEAALGLHHAHRCLNRSTGEPLNIIHRDISPHNIMVSFEGEVKIIDFGIAKAGDDLENTKIGTLKGKFSYMSPEQVRGESVDLRSDIFSLGIVAWELFAHQRLFTANNEAATLRKVAECSIPSLRSIKPNIPESLENVILKALSKNKNNRYKTASEFHNKLNEILNKACNSFSQHNFSSMLKSLYSDEILEARQKLINYSKIENQTKKQNANNKFTYEAMQDFPDLKGIGALTVDRTGKENNRSYRKKHLALKNFQKKNTITRSVSSPQKSTETNFLIYYAKKNRVFSSFLQIFLIIGISSGVYFGWGNKIHSFVQSLFYQNLDTPRNIARKKFKINFKSIESGLLRAKKNEENFYITSRPSGANIFINGKYLNKVTPSLIQVPLEKSFSIKLIKEGFLTYQRPRHILKRSSKRSFTARLQKLSLAYIDIDIQPPIQATIYINNAKLLEPLPITKYSIRANEEVVIKVKNSLGIFFDVKRINLKKGEHRSILFDGKRIPAGR